MAVELPRFFKPSLGGKVPSWRLKLASELGVRMPDLERDASASSMATADMERNGQS